jgi:pilus assembly protein Flp/PilA
MHRLTKKITRFVRSEEGPTSVEYAIMLVLIIAVCLIAVRTVGTNTRTLFTNSANSIAS